MVKWMCTEVSIFKQIPRQYHEELYILFWILQGVIKSATEKESVAWEIEKLPPNSEVAVYLVAALNKKEWVRALNVLRDSRYRPLFTQLSNAKVQVPEDKMLLNLELQFKRHHPEFVMGFMVGSEKRFSCTTTAADEHMLSRHSAEVIQAVAVSKRP